jgi:MFS family permease
MTQRQLKTGYFIHEGLNSFGTTYYFYYLYFFMQKQFAFDTKANLLLAALNGFLYMVASWSGGKFAQRFGYFTALKLGLGVMILAMGVGAQVETALAHILVMALFTVGTCFTWPTLEALVSEGETPAGLQRMVGTYNMVWAGTSALAYFTGGAMLEKLGMRSLFLVPIVIHVFQIVMTFWLEARARTAVPAGSAQSAAPGLAELNPRPIAKARAFLRMAWLANPFAYIAINTLVAAMPGVANRLELSTMLAGFCCSVWCFARFGAFVALWAWPGWHYRFRWLLLAFISLVGTFAIILTVPSLAVLILAQVLLGGALGLIYYSSLFYSMDVGETKGEHGGFHEAAIGFGNFAGPAVGAASLHFLPQYAHSGALAVSAVLLLGLGGLVGIWHTQRTW